MTCSGLIFFESEIERTDDSEPENSLSAQFDALGSTDELGRK